MERSMGWRPVRRGRPRGDVRVHDHARHVRPARRRLHLPVGRHRHARLGGRAGERHAGWPTWSRAWSGCRSGAEHDADITCDPVGSAIHDGGMSATARDLARFGQLLLDDGRRRRRRGGPGGLAGRRAGTRLPPYARRSRTPTTRRCCPAAGTATSSGSCPCRHGDGAGVPGHPRPDGLRRTAATRTVGVKLSSWPEPQNSGYLIDTLRAFGAIGLGLSSARAAHA